MMTYIDAPTTVMNGSADSPHHHVPPPSGVQIQHGGILVTLEQTGTPVHRVDSLAQRFARLVDQWRHDTRGLSSSDAIAMHPAYQEIIGMGRGALRLILRELNQRPDHWFWALTMIAAPENPVPPAEAGRMETMRQRWLDWGKNKGYLAAKPVGPRTRSPSPVRLMS